MTGWPCALYLENGHHFSGLGFGAKTTLGGEVVFNTGMSGYQEIFTDPSYSKQIVTMTYPHLGNTGVNSEDVESDKLHLSGVVAREYTPLPSNWRAEQSLDQYLENAGIPGISEIDTRTLTQIIRNEGAQRGVIYSTEGVLDEVKEGKKLIEAVPSMEGLELVSQVSCQSNYNFADKLNGPKKGVFVVLDFGLKKNILRHLNRCGYEALVVPYNTSAKEVLSHHPTAVMLTNGPGDPAQVSGEVIENIKALISNVPIYAICMGHQLLARALGMTTFKLKFGHHGINHPVRDERSGKILVTSQNHGFAVKLEEIESHPDVQLSHVNLNDQTAQGFFSDKLKLLSVQFHPEAAPGPNDASYLFGNFVKGFLE